MDIQAMQKSALLTMLNLNAPPPSAATPRASSTSSATWKVLIYDEACRDIISPLLNVGELRALGVTLNLLITGDRERVPGVPAVYFVAPTRTNLDLIDRDTKRSLYDAFYLNFSYTLPRVLLEDLALRTIESASVSRISRVTDVNAAFITLEPSLFTMNMSRYRTSLATTGVRSDPALRSYAKLSSRDDSEIMACVDAIVESLYSVCSTVGAVPIIHARPGEAAELVASKLDSRLREALRSRVFQESSSASFRRPVLILVDRNLDLGTPLQHQWAYQPMTHDLLGLASNRIRLPSGPAGD